MSSITANKLPVELWHEIFAQSAAILGKDEFTLDGSAYNVMICDGRTSTTKFSRDEELKIIKMRLNIILVCRSWYAMGIQGLWSHLPLVATDTIFHQLDEALEQRPELGNFVIRVTVRKLPISDFTSIKNYSGSLAKVLQRLPSVRIVTCYDVEGLVVSSTNLDVVVLKQLDLAFQDFMTTNPSFGHNIRTLAIIFIGAGSHIFDTPISPEFPRLENLKVSSPCPAVGPAAGRYIAQRWNIPTLRILSITSGHIQPNPWISFINRCPQLEKLELLVLSTSSTNTHPTIPQSNHIHLPHLSTLYTNANFTLSWAAIVQAPALRRLGIILPPPASNAESDRFMNLANSIFNLYPDIVEVCIGIRRNMEVLEPGRKFQPKDLFDWYQRCLSRKTSDNNLL